jgi:hypothetical protein
MKTYCLAALSLLVSIPLFAQTRSFDSIFPNLASDIRNAAFSQGGYIESAKTASKGNLVGSQGIDPEITGTVLGKKPGFLVESLVVIPANKTMLEIYNVLGNIRDLKGRLYTSHTRNERVPLFEDATRIESAKKNNPIPDPRPASSIPRTETVYIMLKDTNFGTSYYRGNMAQDSFGIRYCLTNNKSLTYFLIPVIKEEKFTAQLYFEPIKEGILIYSIAGADVSDFVSSKIDMPSAISKRLAVIISWAADGLRGN